MNNLDKEFCKVWEKYLKGEYGWSVTIQKAKFIKEVKNEIMLNKRQKSEVVLCYNFYKHLEKQEKSKENKGVDLNE